MRGGAIVERRGSQRQQLAGRLIPLAKTEPAVIEVPTGDLPDPWQFIDMPKVRGI